MNFHFNKLSYYKLVRQFTTNVCDFQKKNHYDCLGITPKATQTDVKSAYYKLSKQYHPDINKHSSSAADKFRDITEAYEVLGNIKSRKLYDRGMSVRGDTVQDYASSKPEEPVPDNYQHASFYHGRNKPPSRRPSIDLQVKYDMDAWTKAHYSEIFTKQHDKKVNNETFVRERLQEQNDQATLVLPVVAIIFLAFIGMFFFKINPSNEKFDTPNLKTEKPN